jgi:hypothetical protein
MPKVNITPFTPGLEHYRSFLLSPDMAQVLAILNSPATQQRMQDAVDCFGVPPMQALLPQLAEEVPFYQMHGLRRTKQTARLNQILGTLVAVTMRAMGYEASADKAQGSGVPRSMRKKYPQMPRPRAAYWCCPQQ